MFIKKSNFLPNSLLKINHTSCKSTSTLEYDVVVIGGGIIGTAVAKTVQEKSKQTRIALLEKEQQVGQHQSSHNSNVIHAGIYYKTNSLKAKLCSKGAELIYDYCNNKNIPVKRCGKLVIASDWLETHRLKVLYKRSLENGISGLTLLKNWKDVLEIQPNCNGLQALWSPNTGNVDWKTVTEHFAQDFMRAGGDIFFNCKIKYVKESASSQRPVLVEVDENKTFLAKFAVMCLGLHSGTLLDSGENDEYRNISLKVNYQLLNPRMNKFIKTNIYAMPNIDMPFIGVHVSPMVDGTTLLGPSAVPALKLDGYRTNEVDLNYVKNNIFSKHFGLLFLKNFPTCLNQVAETICNDTRTQVLKKYFPMICTSDVLPGPAAVQGQVVTKDGEFVDDFMIQIFQGEGIEKRLINCKFLPSPGATCALAVAELVNEHFEKVCV